jgi:hypothetical protein
MNAEKSKLFEDLLVELQEETIKLLLTRVKAGDATSAEMAQVVQLCKLNDVNIEITESDIPDDVRSSLKSTVAGEKFIPFHTKAVGE